MEEGLVEGQAISKEQPVQEEPSIAATQGSLPLVLDSPPTQLSVSLEIEQLCS